MSLLYSKLRLQIPQISDGKNATITSPRGVNRTVPLTYPLTDVFVAGMEKYTVQAGTGSETFSVGNGKFKKIVTEDASALTVASMPTTTTYLKGTNLDLTGLVVNASMQKGDGTSSTENVTSLATYDPPDGTQLNTQGTQRIDINYFDVSSFFNVSVVVRSMLKKLPYSFYAGGAVILDGEIHILGGGVYSSTRVNHYKWTGSSWISVSTLPYNFFKGAFVVWNNEIHLLGAQTFSTDHYKWDGTSWTVASTLPNGILRPLATIYNNEIHLFSENKHYKWDGSSWSLVSTLPYTLYGNDSIGNVTVCNNEIHILSSGNSSYYRYHYKWDGSNWSSVSTLPYYAKNCGVVTKNNIIYLLGGSDSSQTVTNFYKWDGSSWSSVSTLPYEFATNPALLWNSGADDEIILLGSAFDDYMTYDAQWDGTSWTVGSD